MAERYRVESEAALREVHDHLPQETAPDGKPWNWNADAHIRAVLCLCANLDKKAYPKTEKTGDPSTSADALRTIKKPEKARQWGGAYLKYGTLRSNNDCLAGSSLKRPTAHQGLLRHLRTGHFLSASRTSSSAQRANARARRHADPRHFAQGWEKFIVADFSQVELLIAGTIARRPGSAGTCWKSSRRVVCVHTATAATMMGGSLQGHLGQRTLAKAVNFGLVYGAKAETLLEYARNNYGIVDMTLEDAQGV